MKTPYQNGFMLSLILIALLGLIWLFLPFIPALFFALIISVATFSKYKTFTQRFSDSQSAILMLTLVILVLILPLGYLLLVGGIEVGLLIQSIHSNFDSDSLANIVKTTFSALPLTESIQQKIFTSLNGGIDHLLVTFKDFSIAILSSIVSLSSNFILFVLIVIFSLYYLYVDGESLIQKVKNLTPLENHLDDFLIKQFSGLSVVLLGSVFSIALIQGVVFALGVAIIGLPPLFFGIAMALASFIPVLGGLIIWLPLSLFLYAQGQIVDALVVVVFGALIIGTLIDHFLRPIITKNLSNRVDVKLALDHTFITVLSTLAGIIQFGVLGLFIGPIIAAMAISIFDVYELKYTDSLDKS